MRVIHKSDELDGTEGAVGVGLGNFDGLHIGHMALINVLIRESKLNGLKSLVYTFTKHPENIIRKKLFTTILTSVDKKVELLGETALDYLYFDEFDESYSRVKPEDFIKNILVDRLQVKLAVAGFNYRFGYRGEGDVDLLKEFGRKYGFRVIIIPKIIIGEDIVSSTLIRQSVARGDMDRVFNLMGRHYSLSGRVEKGKQLGNTLGFPTANIYPEDYLTLPGHGVYVTKTLINGVLHNSVTNIGKNPTFEGQDRVSIETHILDFDGDIYGQWMEVFFILKLRGEKKFKGKDELVRQIRLDAEKTREYLGIHGVS
ncbi:MAG: bifunctional riboflavin kinase/FAD synthetase [Clostridiales bacterium]|jgi:riboflavin kinase/FMN adenylyltransferase|nr:bifunctional riboflavin kinase/FAD synthetase [Eubacteriales bacterium]MDH7564913.1 bifunctional riboflavin kinase/FAD synthetase [Clostridiales bacterium]